MVIGNGDHCVHADMAERLVPELDKPRHRSDRQMAAVKCEEMRSRLSGYPRGGESKLNSDVRDSWNACWWFLGWRSVEGKPKSGVRCHPDIV